ncbi:MAG: FCD domain-containing protein, partial [Mesorhizobium sp.]
NTRIHFVRKIEVEKHRRLSTTYTEHSEIARAMVARDADGAARLMHDHIAISVADAVSTVREGLARIYVDVDVDQ